MIQGNFMHMDVQAAIWRNLAQKTAAVAAQLHDAELRLSMLTIASHYEAMASRAEVISRERQTTPTGEKV